MAVSAPPIPSEPSKPPVPSPLSKLISKLRSKRRSKPPPPPTQIITLPPLIPTPLPLVLPEHQHLLSHYGWTTITLPPSPPSNPLSTTTPPPGPHPLQIAYLALFHAAQSFFNSPHSEKEKWSHPLSTEQGYTHIPGEKEFLTLRSLSHTPDVLKQPAARYWALMGAHLSTTLGRISTSLGLPSGEDEGLRKFVGPCAVMGEDEKTASMLRIFRYEAEGEKVVAEAHSDLGLLSAVVGDVAGLEVWDGGWRDVERGYEGGEVTVMGGRQLERLGNGRYPAGGHRVVSYGVDGEGGGGGKGKEGGGGDNKEAKRYRHSIVFVLRAHEPVLVESDELETEITGRWGERVSGVTAGEMYEEIRGRHFNINIGHEERERQRRNVREGRGKGVERVGVGKAAG